MSEPLTRAERDDLLRQMREIDARLYPDDEDQEPSPREETRLEERALVLQGEYADRLPRVLMGRCPFTGAPLKRCFDPFGLDGPWWGKGRTFKPDEPKPPATFRVLLGALDLRGRVPSEAIEEVIPGPGVPFVVPRLLELPGMVAVISRLTLATGDLAYPIAYFSQSSIAPEVLHQFWTRPVHWFKTAEGGSGWIIANDIWDFELAPWIEAGKLFWISPGDADAKVHGRDSGVPCPYLGLPGERMQQTLSDGECELSDPPNGEPVSPFEAGEEEDEEPDEDEEEEGTRRHERPHPKAPGLPARRARARPARRDAAARSARDALASGRCSPAGGRSCWCSPASRS